VFRTTKDAPRGRIVRLDVEIRAVEVVPNRKIRRRRDALRRRARARVLHDAHSVIRRQRCAAMHSANCASGLGTASGFGGKQSDVETFSPHQLYDTVVIIASI